MGQLTYRVPDDEFSAADDAAADEQSRRKYDDVTKQPADDGTTTKSHDATARTTKHARWHQHAR